MKPAIRWAIVIAVIVVIAILLWLWNRGDQQEAPTDTGVVQQQPVATAPPAPKPVEPVMASVLFDYNKSAVRSGEAAKLDEHIARFKGGAFGRIEAIGHADRIGSDGYNQGLSERRAEAVRGYLTGKGVDAGKIATGAKGKTLSKTGDACRNLGAENRKNRKLIDCLQPDRRVEITLVPAR